MKVLRMRSWNFHAENLDEMTRFYQAALGAELRTQHTVGGVKVTRLRAGETGLGLFDASENLALLKTMQVTADDLVKLLLALVLGGLIGWERELYDKPAGFRTNTLICVGSTLFTIFSLKIGIIPGTDSARIAAQIVSGIGFLGAGAIIRRGEAVL